MRQDVITYETRQRFRHSFMVELACCRYLDLQIAPKNEYPERESTGRILTIMGSSKFEDTQGSGALRANVWLMDDSNDPLTVCDK